MNSAVTIHRTLGLISVLLSLSAIAGGPDSQAPDRVDGPTYVLSGSWNISTLPGADERLESYWTQQDGASATWHPAFAGPVRARVALHRIVHSGNNDRAVKVEVVHGGRIETQTIDFSTGSTDWITLGTFDFEGNEKERVSLTRGDAAEGVTRASAIRFDVLGHTGEVIQSFTLNEVTAGPLARPATQPFNASAVRSGPPDPNQWAVTFDETFEGTSLDQEVWAMESGAPRHITSSRWPENVQVRDGLLRLLTRKESRGGKEWTTGNIWTRTFKQQYGYFEARMKIGSASGLNNAFWLMTTNKRTDPMHFEIDIAEAKYPFRNNISLHNWSGDHWAKGK